jgi:uncharacterized phage protein (TIGR01671 family)
MRKILFRAKSIQTGRWITGYYFEDEDGKSYIGYMSKERYIPDTRDWDMAEYYENNPTYNWVFVKEEVDSETVGEYTGLIDKNGTKIFEGDTVRVVYNTKEFEYIVVWDESESGFKATNGKENYEDNFQYLGCCDEIEVIGNIYD